MTKKEYFACLDKRATNNKRFIDMINILLEKAREWDGKKILNNEFADEMSKAMKNLGEVTITAPMGKIVTDCPFVAEIEVKNNGGVVNIVNYEDNIVNQITQVFSYDAFAKAAKTAKIKLWTELEEIRVIKTDYHKFKVEYQTAERELKKVISKMPWLLSKEVLAKNLFTQCSLNL